MKGAGRPCCLTHSKELQFLKLQQVPQTDPAYDDVVLKLWLGLEGYPEHALNPTSSHVVPWMSQGSGSGERGTQP